MTKKTKTGKKAGEKKFTVKLIIPPFSFRKKTTTNNIGSKVIFICNGCEKEDMQVVAHGILENLENGRPEYSLCSEPPMKNHVCKPSPVQYLEIFKIYRKYLDQRKLCSRDMELLSSPVNIIV